MKHKDMTYKQREILEKQIAEFDVIEYDVMTDEPYIMLQNCTKIWLDEIELDETDPDKIINKSEKEIDEDAMMLEFIQENYKQVYDEAEAHVMNKILENE